MTRSDTPAPHDGANPPIADAAGRDHRGLDDALARFVELLKQREATVATAESLTGGLVGSTLTDVPGISAVYRGGVIVYATDLKATLAGVPKDLLAAVGPVHADTASALAVGVRERLGAVYGLATTGVAGPDPQAGIQAGTVYVAAAGPGTVLVRKLSLRGDRSAVRWGSVEAVLRLGAELMAEDSQ
ncbi:CinA family protein [Kribbella sp. CA-253562]|uniref:CinA family protein n=1 Tax=Kribbella sp. CA-253562 TaxID=3239942 RepID=UPI003D90CD5C